MSLYDDVVTDFTAANSSDLQNDTATNWGNSGSFKLMQMQVEQTKKRQSMSKVKPAFSQKVTKNIAPVIDLSDKRGKPQLQLKKEIIPEIVGSQNVMPIISKIESKLEEASSIYSSMAEEYDPMKPNDYEKINKDLFKSNKVNKENLSAASRSTQNNNDRKSDSRRKYSRSRSRSRDRKKNKRSSRRHSRSRSRSSRDGNGKGKKSSKGRNRHSGSSSDSDDRSSRKRKHDDRNSSNNRRQDEVVTKRVNNNAFAPPPSLLENNTIQVDQPERAESALPTKSLFGNLKAEKMMAKMGYKEGDGLGRNKQGMSIALQIEKTGKRIGRIIHEKDVVEPIIPVIVPPEPIIVAPPPVPASPVVGITADVMKNMSKVILLTNMVAPGDVDEDLEAETKEECAKYGEVNKCLIYELPNKSPEEAVRIFLEFKTLPSAIKALTDLNGRFFGGRLVKANFYNLDKFKQLELND